MPTRIGNPASISLTPRPGVRIHRSTLELLLLMVLLLNLGGCTIDISMSSKKPTSGDGALPSVDSVALNNGQIVLSGKNLSEVQSIKIQGKSNDFTIDQQSDTSISASTATNLEILAGAAYSLFLSTASADTVVPITLTLEPNSVPLTAISNAGILDQQILQYSSAQGRWLARDLNGLNFIATWDASQAFPGTSSNQNGDFYIVSNSGTTNVNGINLWDIGDWAIYNGTSWEKVNNTGGVTSFNNRRGAITATFSDLSDVNINNPVDGSLLKYDSASQKWVVGSDNAGGGGTIAQAATYTAAGTALTVNNSAAIGNSLLVGNTSGSASADLHVMASTADLLLQTTSNSASSLIFQNSASTNGAVLSVQGTTGQVSGTGANDFVIGQKDNNSMHLISNNSVGLTVAPTGYVGIGTTNPIGEFHLSSNSETDLMIDSFSDTFNFNPLIGPRRARGTASAPTAVANGDTLFEIWAEGYNGSAYTPGAAMFMSVDGSVSGSGANDMPGRITFATTPNGSGSLLERMRINNAGYVGIGTTNPTSILSISSDNSTNIQGYSYSNNPLDNPVFQPRRARGTAVSPAAVTSDDDIGEIYAEGYNGSGYSEVGMILITVDGTVSGGGASDMPGRITFHTTPDGSGTAQERMRINNSGYVGIGTMNPTGHFHLDSNTETRVNVGAHSDSPFLNPLIATYRSRGTEAAPTAVANGDTLYEQIAFGYNGSAYNYVARMLIEVDGAVTGGGANDLPTRMTFSTTPDGSGADVERMRIANSGNVGINTTNPSEKLHVVGNLRVQGSTDCTLGTGAGATNCTSDGRLKENITPITGALQKIQSLRGVEFDWNSLALAPGKHAIGVIAQDVQKVFPTAVVENESGYLGVDYAVLVSPLIEALKELNYRCEQSEVSAHQKIAVLSEEVINLKSQNELMKNYLCQRDPSAPFCQ